MSSMSTNPCLRMNLIAAACDNMGIGKDGQLPWHLPNEFAYFVRMTSQTRDPSKRNAVIVGRKTWDSLPPKFRPLKGRYNVLLSRSLVEAPTGVDLLCKSLDEAVEALSFGAFAGKVETIWNIGGVELYKLGIASPHVHRIYLTRIFSMFECDTFFPEFDREMFLPVEVDEGTPGDMQEEKGVRYKFEVFEKRRAS